MKIAVYLFIFLIYIPNIYGQVLPFSRSVNWTTAGSDQINIDHFPIINIESFGGATDGVTPNDEVIANAISSLSEHSGVIYFPPGAYLFTQTITLTDSIILRGDPSGLSTLIFDLNGKGHAIKAQGRSVSSVNLVKNVSKGDTKIWIDQPDRLNPGDHLQISFDDQSLITSDWAFRSVGQIVKVLEIKGNEIFLNNELRRSYHLSTNPKANVIDPVKSVGIECLKMVRKDRSAEQTSNIYLKYATNSWIKGVESDHCNFAHVTISKSSNISVTGSYFHHAFEYGGGGKAYGVVAQYTSGDCLVENNIFEHLRHSMLLQAGANGNVFSYNYSTDPYWDNSDIPSNLAGDIVLHGNYPYANLFEGNIVENIIIDDSHGINGPHNTFLRNRTDLYGFLTSFDNPSDDQNFIGNEITNSNGLYGQFIINGKGHFLYGNNVRGVITPENQSVLKDTSYYREKKPFFLTNFNWPAIGPPHPLNTHQMPAKTRFATDGKKVVCTNDTFIVGLPHKINSAAEITIYPNPANKELIIQSDAGKDLLKAEIYTMNGHRVFFYSNSFTGDHKPEFVPQSSTSPKLVEINIENLKKGIYLIKITTSGGFIARKIFIE